LASVSKMYVVSAVAVPWRDKPGGETPALYGSPDIRCRGATILSVSVAFRRLGMVAADWIRLTSLGRCKTDGICSSTEAMPVIFFWANALFPSPTFWVFATR
jgi:hypothetical protein